jgi:predicted Rossmann-fold nucleotide-binding protein
MIPIILVVGSHKDEDGEIHKAKCETVAGLLVKHRVHLLTGGGPGVMAKVSQFFVKDPKRTAGQCCLGVLPCDENDLSTKKTGYPNDWVEIPIQTHLPGKKKVPGKKKGVDTPKDHNSRNYINVLTAKAVIGLPGGKGTLAEIELAVEHKRPCVTFLDNEDQIEGLPESVFKGKIRNIDEAKLDKFLKAVLKASKV